MTTSSKKILFVAGLMTDLMVGDQYAPMRDYLPLNTTWFRYKTKDSRVNIQERLQAVYLQLQPDVIIGHSFGCVFITHLLKKITRTCVRVIFLMPLVSRDINVAKYGSFAPSILDSCCYYPVGLFPLQNNSKCIHPAGNIQSDVCCIPLELFLDGVRLIDLSTDVETFERHHITIIYGLKDQVTTLSSSVLRALEPVVSLCSIDSGHTPFNDCEDIRAQFKAVFLHALNSVGFKKKIQKRLTSTLMPVPEQFHNWFFCF